MDEKSIHVSYGSTDDQSKEQNEQQRRSHDPKSANGADNQSRPRMNAVLMCMTIVVVVILTVALVITTIAVRVRKCLQLQLVAIYSWTAHAVYNLRLLTGLLLQCGPVNNHPPPLNDAIKRGYEVKAHRLIQQGEDVNTEDCVS